MMRRPVSLDNHFSFRMISILRLVLPDIAHTGAMLVVAVEMYACGEWQIAPEPLAARFDIWASAPGSN
jgi:hypothetical protein